MSTQSIIIIVLLIVLIIVIGNAHKVFDGQKGGLLIGPQHTQGGIPTVVKVTGDKLNVQGGEAIINEANLQIKDQYNCTGTPAGIASAINELNGMGVKFADGGNCVKIK